MYCELCNSKFEQHHLKQKYCSPKCYTSAKNKRRCQKNLLEKRYNNLCEICKVAFRAAKKQDRFCSVECRKTSFSSKLKKFIDIPDCIENASRKLDKKLGYVRVYVPMHPEANTWGYVYEHRVIAEQMIQRCLKKDEIVHHKNGKRWDNRSENLEVMNKNDHAKLQGQRDEDLLI